ncbi:SDR family NAD(P)-dependent oxidoreductase [Nocardioides nanhaiensis]|uniref:SDR family NAD(P)-dependent oxidoreductase n=1 Tax=Nocardioides nanhaiensis TaxID=1476871 RepID=A0ABP8VVX4_9ACTN
MTARVALVTGAASGIGAACAARLAASHEVVVLADLDAARLPQVAEAVRAAGAEAVEAPLDVCDEEQVQGVHAVAASRGRLVSAVNSAGVGGPAVPVVEYSLDAWRRVLDVDLTGVFLCLREQARAMIEAGGGGSIVAISSVLAHRGEALAPAYAAAKHGLEGLVRSAALGHAAQGVRVNSVAPGFIDTALLRERRTPEERERLAHRAAQDRLGGVDEVAAVVEFLCSAASEFVTGSCYRVDGGLLA